MLCPPLNSAMNKDSLFEYLNASTFTYSLQKTNKQTNNFDSSDEKCKL